MSARILFVSYTADWTGPTNSLLLLLRQLRLDYRVAVLLPGRGRFSEALASEGIRHVSLPSLTKWTLPRMMRLIRGEQFDLVYANSTHRCARLAFVAARTARLPYMCHVREMVWDRSWPALGYLRWAAAVIAVSRSCAASVRRFVRPQRLHVVHNGIQLPQEGDQNGRDRERLRASLGLSSDAVVLLGVAHLCPRKGQEHAIRTIAIASRAVPELHLCLAGSETRDPRYVTHLRELVGSLGLEDRVHFLGFRPDVGRLLGAADVFLHTASTDPHPRSVLEAMAVGLPVVAFGVDGVAETVIQGETGYLTDCGDTAAVAEAVLDLATRPDRARRMGEAGRSRVASEFCAQATAARVGHVVEMSISGRGS